MPGREAVPPLAEGIDYYIEAGRWVFTAAYHRRRGYCCASGCRHCPYPSGDEVPAPDVPTRDAMGMEPG